jgi:hypothetical protein
VNLDAEFDILTRQMVGKSLAPGHRGGGGVALPCRRMTGLDMRNIGVEIFQAEGKLIAVDPFGTPPELHSLQPRNDKPEFVDLGLRPGKLGTFPGHLRGQVTYQGVQRTDIDGQRGEIEVHVCESNAGGKQNPTQSSV